MSETFDPNNPFAASTTQSTGAGDRPKDLTVFTRVMVILSLVFSILRIPMVGFGILGFLQMQQAGGNPIGPSVPFEILTGVLVAFFGIIGNIMILMKKPMGIKFGWALVIAVLASMATGVWQAFIIIGAMPQGSPQQVGGMIGGGITLLIRGALLIMYIIALKQAAMVLQGTNDGSAADSKEQFMSDQF